MASDLECHYNEINNDILSLIENPITYNSCWYIVGVFGLYLVYRLYLVDRCIEFTSVR